MSPRKNYSTMFLDIRTPRQIFKLIMFVFSQQCKLKLIEHSGGKSFLDSPSPSTMHNFMNWDLLYNHLFLCCNSLTGFLEIKGGCSGLGVMAFSATKLHAAGDKSTISHALHTRSWWQLNHGTILPPQLVIALMASTIMNCNGDNQSEACGMLTLRFKLMVVHHARTRNTPFTGQFRTWFYGWRRNFVLSVKVTSRCLLNWLGYSNFSHREHPNRVLAFGTIEGSYWEKLVISKLPESPASFQSLRSNPLLCRLFFSSYLAELLFLVI